ncbi:helix-hairpin-helix domain-containing protein [Sabulilitoribacter multivorans]|uniref:Helix-hairpin-helix domain-containing protein n=1 Tax=Flaviramulus multivorans TaxID=1304750 RepID=A0ABS9II17_9FLAO|nr:helix-hairpin-helix domain-containing protein [Flaviramulus multivorans]MCF7560397.1 helix-hairpin-helix domain-containing protein [Flaviramulus multivorans]
MKSHFTFTKQQRNGIFLLILLIIIMQCVYFFVDFTSDNIDVDKETILKFEREIDSLKQVQLEESKPKIFPFNPNYITDYRGATLGMTNEEIDRLLNFRKQNKWINSTEQFQEVTQVSDSLLDAISPYFKFPEWVTNPKPSNITYSYSSQPKSYGQKQDLNTATAQQLQKVNGIGDYYSKRIVEYRNKFKGGFISDVQLQDIYGLTPEVIERITNDFTVKTPRVIKKLNLNSATIDDLVTVQHIDYDLANEIIEQRILREGYKSLDELKKVKGFPVNKIEIIKLYLHLEKENK